MTVEQDTAVRHSVSVPLAPERAFALFTDRMAAWWPATHSIGTSTIADVVVEPAVGGRWFERGTDGSECSWGRVAVWEPPHRLVLVWQISAQWRFDPGLETEVEVTFSDEGPDRTRLDLVHRGLEAYGDAAATLRDVFGSPGGWPGILGEFEGAVEREPR